MVRVTVVVLGGDVVVVDWGVVVVAVVVVVLIRVVVDVLLVISVVRFDVVVVCRMGHCVLVVLYLQQVIIISYQCCMLTLMRAVTQ